MVPDVGFENVAPERVDAPRRVRGERDAAALAGVVGRLEIALEGRAAVLGDREVEGGPAVLRGGPRRGHGIPLVDPRDEEAALAVERQRVEAVGDLLAVAVHGERRSEGPPPVEGTREADRAAVGLREGLGPGHKHLPAHGDQHLGPRVAAGVEGLGRGVDHDRHGPGGARIVRTPDEDAPVLVRDDPQAALRVHRGGRAQVRALDRDGRRGGVGVRGVGRGRGAGEEQREAEEQGTGGHRGTGGFTSGIPRRRKRSGEDPA